MANSNYRMVKDLIIELEKFPPDARCYAYEGEIAGIVINYKKKQGVIHNSPSCPTELIKGIKL